MDDFYTLTACRADGSEVSFEQFRGSAVLIVNTASQCGFTPQLDGLQKLYDQFKDRGFVILGFPCDQFARQEPLNNGSITEFCRLNYGVTFPIFAKCSVNGKETHEVFRFLKSALPGVLTDDIKWNFTKFLVNSEGKPVRRFAPVITPEKIAKHVESCLTTPRKQPAP